MWLSKTVLDALARTTDELDAARSNAARMVGENTRLLVEVSTLRNDIEWFKHRLNQVEQERGTLILAQTGVKVPIPEFVPQYENTAQSLSEMPDFSTVGGDAYEDTPPVEEEMAFSFLPKRTR